MPTIPDELVPSAHRTSPLLQLPAELRNIIYFKVISNHNIVVCGTHKCSSCQDERYRDPSTTLVVHCPPDVLSLSTTCREIYFETRLLVLSTNRFCGYTKDLMALFDKYFADSQIDAITSLCVIAGENMEFTGLRRLRGVKSVVVKTWDERVQAMASWRHISRLKVFGMIRRRMMRELGMFGDAEHVEVMVLGQDEGLDDGR